MSWLDLVPVSTDAYAFQAALLCEDCGRAAVKQCALEQRPDDGDSSTFPQGPYPDGGGESDSTGFCDNGKECVNAVQVKRHKVGCPLGNPLTRDGAESLRESVLENMLSRKKYSRMLGRLLRRVWGAYLDELPTQVKTRFVDKLPDSLLAACKAHHEAASASRPRPSNYYKGFHTVALANPDYAFLAYEKHDVLELCRFEVDDEGEFKQAEVARVPLDSTGGKSVTELVTEAFREGAWD